MSQILGGWAAHVTRGGQGMYTLEAQLEQLTNMASIHSLTSDLTNLVSESRRKSPEIKHAAEFSLEVLKKYSPDANEQQVLKQLAQEPNFITPFLLSCQFKNTKLSTISIHSLQGLIAVHGIPVGSIDNILDCLIESTNLALEIQLKVLQLLPTLYQSYGNHMNGSLISKLLLICAILQSPNKSMVVINTAAATLQQLVIFIFDKINEEDKLDESDVLKLNQVKIDDDEVVRVSDNVNDCYLIFSDLCSLIEHQKPQFLKFNFLTETFLLELVESVLSNFSSIFLVHRELGFLLRFRITPILLRILSIPSKPFSIIVRITRIIYLLIRKYLDILTLECEVVISLLNHMILSESESPVWKKILVLEIFNGVFKDYDLTESIFQKYDFKNRKHVINDFFINCFCLIDSPASRRLLSVKSVLHEPIHSTSDFLVDNGQKLLYIDMLDKSEPPVVPENYLYYLVLSSCNNFVEGNGKFIMDMKTPNDEEDLRYQLALEIINKNYRAVLSIYEIYLYSRTSNDCFKNLIRALQKLCYSSGIVGLHKPRNDIILLFAIASINNIEEKKHKKEKKEVEPAVKEPKSLGETIFGRFSHTATSGPPPVPVKSVPTPDPVHTASGPKLVVRSRYLNSRQLITLKALVNLGLSLGPSLSGNWNVIFTALQWFNYYINGPSKEFIDKYSYKETNNSPLLKPNEVQSAENSIRKLLDSTKNYLLSSFITIQKSLIELSDVVLEERSSEDELFQSYSAIAIKSNDSYELIPCYYNRTFYLDLFSSLCRFNSSRFLNECVKSNELNLLILNDEDLDHPLSLKILLNYLIEICVNRNLASNFRLESTEILNEIVRGVSNEGILRTNEQGPATRNILIEHDIEYKLLYCKYRILTTILELQKQPAKGQVIKCEFEIIIKLLENMKDILDLYGVSFNNNSWLMVFDIINLQFKFESFNEKKADLVKFAFILIQLILNDFLNILPLKVVKKLVDSLYEFSIQKYDINISFSAISYFWQISDYLRIKERELESDGGSTQAEVEGLERIDEHENDQSTELSELTRVGDAASERPPLSEKTGATEITSAGLVDLLSDIQNDNSVTCKYLWIYLLKILVDIINNQNDQVKNSSLQIYFRIIETHGKYLNNWDLSYNVIVSSLLDIKPDIQNVQTWAEVNQLREQWSESLILIINGLIKVYENFFCNFGNLNLTYWDELIRYFEEILKLNWNNVDLKLYQSFEELVSSLPEPVPVQVSELLFDFWSNRNISYNVTINKNYQDSLTNLMKIFIPLIKIIKLDDLKIEKSVNLFNSVVKYPILPTHFNDNVHPTDLQKSVLENLKLILKADSETSSTTSQSALILQLISNVVLPFSTRQKIKQQLITKLQKDTKICTFSASSFYSVKLLKVYLNNCQELQNLIENQTVNRLISSLLEPIKMNAKGIKTASIDFKDENVELWIQCTQILLKVIHKSVSILAADDGAIDTPIKEQFWYLVVEFYRTGLNMRYLKSSYQEFNTLSLKSLKGLILPYVSLPSFPESLVENFVNYILESSYVYEKDEIEVEILKSKKIEDIAEQFLNFKYPMICSELKFVPMYRINLICLNDLIELSKLPSAQDIEKANQAEDAPKDMEITRIKSKILISEKIFSCLIVRSLYTLARFMSSECMINPTPMPKIQRLELMVVLKGLNDLLDNIKLATIHLQTAKYNQLSLVLPLIIRTVPLADKVRGITGMVEQILFTYNENLKVINRSDRTKV